MRKVLNLVDEDGHGGISFLGGFGHGSKQIGEINLQVPTIGRSSLGFDVQTYLNLANSHLDGTNKAPEHRKAATHLVAGTSQSVQIKKQTAKMRSQHGGKGFPFVRLNENCAVVILLGKTIYLVQQNGFTNASEPCEKHALLRSPFPHAAKENPRLLQDSVATNHLWRR